MSDYQNASTEEWLQWDKDHIWHPYSSMLNPAKMVPIVSAKGVRLTLADGTELIDGMSSWWSAIHGYNHPKLNAAATKQLQAMSHVMFGGITHPAAAELGKRLVDLTPPPLSKVFISDSGSVAVEVAIKMALQYWYSIGNQNKTRLIALRNGYHGDTFGAMATCDPVTGMHHLFNKVLPSHIFVESPPTAFGEAASDDDLSAMTAALQEHHHELAAVIVEPVVQGAGGMRFYSGDYLRRLRSLCDEYNVLLIFDEIATGFGRTGKLFACEHAGISPDIMCLGKALTGGYLSLAATLCNDRIAEGICHGEAGVFMHGPTFMGNPLACSIANASIELLLSSDWESNIRRIEKILSRELSKAVNLPSVADVRCLGAIGVIELKDSVDMASIQARFIDKGIWIRPFGKLVYTMPPYIINDTDLIQLCQHLVAAVAEEE
ncbi:Adenosylmethionine-8-amino-7-oxononanoate aminotransferase [Zhongshania aliphaticivorans]|uniref:Adenosylmethionine-8-amino-7-oxononanoate aminotransferase n=1 Tax=Zhongshania aliphaticivorans TaxID=1470434 RepID=A0A5S9NCN5_9GAMM|nr:adenosylmethionine--8-amino-7-oxononanoate transaminase [Zhongshania aliphaticivorans]CAA0087674.1 Adenosylmethionine-8-amino-7-oxononanoate aminotransferase [Zhongshania aliphaticivorans]CAA0115298.1 Adenosylmethionine-8-amino-7-oxononanoate aminotransferase [Zhongshania aliphaticivorans]CAA0120134.1 Adenosylmethionine-8-amino-7-oxononanoate aminotransferase [Zhongshania aliphaticivorans]